MKANPVLRSTAHKLAIFRACFSGLTHVYGTYDLRTAKAHQIKRPVTDEVLLRHLKGKQPYGVYLLIGGRTRALAVDYDKEDTGPPLRFIHQASCYGLQAYIERSKSKGWHVWIFAERPGISAPKVRLVTAAVLKSIDTPNVEVFPKQDSLSDTTSYGNFINAPLFGTRVDQGRTVFVDPERGFAPFPDQWQLLDTVQRVTEHQLDAIIAHLRLSDPRATQQPRLQRARTRESFHSFGLPPCAQRMLAEGVTEYQRVACFRIAVHLRRAGIPQDVAAAALRAWSIKNQPQEGKRIITETEINEQAACAYAKSYRSCGCEEPVVAPFCHPSCPVRCAEPTRKTSSDAPTETGKRQTCRPR